MLKGILELNNYFIFLTFIIIGSLKFSSFKLYFQRQVTLDGKGLLFGTETMNCVPFFFETVLFFFFFVSKQPIVKSLFFSVFSSNIPSIIRDLRGEGIMCALHFQAQSRVAALSSSTICSEPSLKPRDSRKPTRQKLPTMQGNHSKGSV